MWECRWRALRRQARVFFMYFKNTQTKKLSKGIFSDLSFFFDNGRWSMNFFLSPSTSRLESKNINHSTAKKSRTHMHCDRIKIRPLLPFIYLFLSSFLIPLRHVDMCSFLLFKKKKIIIWRKYIEEEKAK